MNKIKITPQGAYVGDKEVKLISYSETIESEIELSLDDLKGVRICDFPELLMARLNVGENSTVVGADFYQIYRASGGYYFNLFLGRDNIFENNLAVKSVYRELAEIVSESEEDNLPEISHGDEAFYIVFDIEISNNSLFEQIISYLELSSQLVSKALHNILGFVWDSEYETNEIKFTRELLIPLLTKIGFEHVRFNHGVSEYGKDILFSERDRFGNTRYLASQVKSGNVTGGSGAVIDTIISQIDDAFSIPVNGAGQQKQFYISELYIICSGNITQNAVRKINEKIDSRLKGSVFFLDIDDITWLVKKYWPI
ncbi:hypothetical protein [Aliikangiella coralliicola]|uniref:Restriction endonuclease n=1 Tax=Aliikangiella coralliicola TaxID=2592383 RepID=A0A545UIV6_9GAMM|nr:hypothetical protein [Aliikangiella coralliicola]TQV89400.1 hypothetical protein FLL46_00520 [Aliikangiella coralliicola]